ncbi:MULTISPECIES: archaeal proteasome endopeptidase complex subunit beta [Halolamina]|uniref:Proteasome subunit beta n=1 Tax=Halolamina pelagica TaxID=699431 RepID=A0A1I5VBK1_9EURY|nr:MULTISPECIES: archaeal proteasome endopeptidase complex subunit beta [Halolamina]NHX37710.1 archaeal proteasome endopeptidase complex subunit beta [Halolamina sp. R1-12]SFQ04771.1 proteasome beta subunit [Halolamina pelagica]
MRTPADQSGLDPLSGDQSDVFGPEIGDFPHADDRRAQAATDDGMKTGTTTVGIDAGDAVVLATDMRASMGNMVSSKDVQKVEQIHPTGALTIAGSVSAAQSLIETLKAESNLFEVRRSKQMSMQALSTLTGNLLRSGAFYIVSPILGGVDDKGSHVYAIDALGGTTEEDYAVSGSGSQFALGVLEQQYEDDMGVEAAKDVATKCIKSAMERDTASGNGINIAVVTDEGVDVTKEKDIESLL